MERVRVGAVTREGSLATETGVESASSRVMTQAIFIEAGGASWLQRLVGSLIHPCNRLVTRLQD
jgi:hypothetical protein